MKIYFAGSIRGGRNDRELYLKIIEKLSFYGTILTEHVADQKLSSYGETHLSDGTIYARDMAWLTEADVVIAEVTTPSLGVGYELGKAESLKKKILCIYREHEGERVSAMVAGNDNFTVRAYEELGDLDAIFERFFSPSL